MTSCDKPESRQVEGHDALQDVSHMSAELDSELPSRELPGASHHHSPDNNNNNNNNNNNDKNNNKIVGVCMWNTNPHDLFQHLVFNTKPKLSRISIPIWKQIQISRLIRIRDNAKKNRMSSWWCRSSHQVWCKSANHCMRTGSHCKMSCHAVLTKVEE